VTGKDLSSLSGEGKLLHDMHGSFRVLVKYRSDHEVGAQLWVYPLWDKRMLIYCSFLQKKKEEGVQFVMCDEHRKRGRGDIYERSGGSCFNIFFSIFILYLSNVYIKKQFPSYATLVRWAPIDGWVSGSKDGPKTIT